MRSSVGHGHAANYNVENLGMEGNCTLRGKKKKKVLSISLGNELGEVGMGSVWLSVTG